MMTSIQTTQQLGEALRSARKALGLTQPQLALAAGVGVRFIVELEAGKPTVRLAQVLRVIDALGGALNLSGLPVNRSIEATNVKRKDKPRGA
jgi:HTH-type transcriptional regulator / antitoxin HipB